MDATSVTRCDDSSGDEPRTRYPESSASLLGWAAGNTYNGREAGANGNELQSARTANSQICEKQRWGRTQRATMLMVRHHG